MSNHAGGGYQRRGGYNGGGTFVGARPPTRWEGDSYENGCYAGGQQQQWSTEAPPPTIQNERWQEPPPTGQWSANDRWKEPQRNRAPQDSRYGNARWKEGGGDSDWTMPTSRDERLEVEMFGTGNSGINFDKYEDIPVEATGNDIPANITSVRFLNFCCLNLFFK